VSALAFNSTLIIWGTVGLLFTGFSYCPKGSYIHEEKRINIFMIKKILINKPDLI
jgi:hypothetical protein